MKRAVFAVCVDNYFPELMQYTLPNLRAYAERMEAEFHVITERKFPDFPPTYEKLQVQKLGAHYDHCMVVDADTMLDPSFPDVMSRVPMDHFGSYLQFKADLLFAADQYFLRDMRKIGVATNLVVSTSWTHEDLWAPLEMTADEVKAKIKRWFIADEYAVSRNCARFGLKITGVLNDDEFNLIHHFDVNTKTPTKEAVVETARALALKFKEQK